MEDLTPAETKEAQECFLYYADDNVLDGSKLAKWLYNLDVNPSLTRLEQLGISTTEGEKKFTFDEALPIFKEIKKEKKDQGCFEDFVEFLRTFDQAENGKMFASDLRYYLANEGEKLPDDAINELFMDCLDDEDEDGEIPYMPFLKRMCRMTAPPLVRRREKND